MLAIGLFSLKLYLVPLLAICILLPLSGILGLIIAAIFVMPIVLRHLEHREYKGVSRQGQFSGTVGIWKAVWVGGLVAVGWILTMPRWLTPPWAFNLQLFWLAFAFPKMLLVDALGGQRQTGKAAGRE